MICLINDGIDNNDYINNTVYNPNALHFVNYGNVTNNAMNNDNYNAYRGRKLISWSSYLETHSTQLETSMNLASFTFLIIVCILILSTFLACFTHSLKTSPLFIAPRMHRLPILTPVKLPGRRWGDWIKVCFYVSDEVIIQRVGYDALMFLRFHRLSLRLLLKMSIFSFTVLLPINYFGGEQKDQLENGLDFIISDFSRFTMANVKAGSPRLWVHVAAVVLLSYITITELLAEYSDFNVIRHRYLLSKEPHLRSVLVKDIPIHLRSRRKITQYFQNMYPSFVSSVSLCENVQYLEKLVSLRTSELAKAERSLLNLHIMEARNDKDQSTSETIGEALRKCCGHNEAKMDREFAEGKERIKELNGLVAEELKRRRRIMFYMDRMSSATGRSNIDFILSRDIQVAPSLSQSHNPHSAIPTIYYNSNTTARQRLITSNIDTTKSFADSPPKSSAFSNDTIENHLIEVTDKCFVSFKTFTAATVACQSRHGTKPGSMKVYQAPEPRAVLWDNIYVTSKARKTRHFLANMFILILIACYAVPMTLLSLLISEQSLVANSPTIARLVRSSGIFSFMVSMIQPMCVVGLQQVLPPLFQAIGKVEGQLNFCNVQIRSFTRYFAFQVVNIFLVTAIAGSIFDTAAQIAENPGYAFQFLGYALPKTSSFFCYYVILKSSLGLGVELVRVVPILQSLIRATFFHNKTVRDRRKVIAGIRPIDDPGWMPMHKIFAQDMLVVLIGVTFAVIAPVVLLPCMVFCAISRIVWTHQFLYVYEACSESGGMYWPKVFRRFVFGIMLAQATVIGQFMLKGAFSQAYVCIVLMITTYFYLKRARSSFDLSSTTLPLEVASVMDINIKAEDIGGVKSNQELYDKAYVQPVLRASPNARMDIPFPNVSTEDDESNDGNSVSAATFVSGVGNRSFGPKEALLAKILLVEEKSQGVCKANMLPIEELEMVEDDWAHSLELQSSKLWKVATGADAGSLQIPNRRQVQEPEKRGNQRRKRRTDMV